MSDAARKRLRRAPERDDPYSVDVNRLVRVANEVGIEVSYADARWAWEQHSDTFAAGWLHLDDDDEELVRVLCSELAIDPDADMEMEL